MDYTLRYHIEFADDPGGFDANSVAAAMDGTVISTVRNFNGTGDLALIDIDPSMRDDMESLLDYEATENESVIAWHTSILEA